MGHGKNRKHSVLSVRSSALIALLVDHSRLYVKYTHPMLCCTNLRQDASFRVFLLYVAKALVMVYLWQLLKTTYLLVFLILACGP